MNCQDLDSVFQPYLDGEFQTEERLEVEAHLTDCTGCAQRIREESQRHQALRRAVRQATGSTRAPDALRARLQSGMRQEQRRASQMQWLRASAAVLVVGAASGAWLTLRPEHHRTFMEDAARRHAKKLPVEIVDTSHEKVGAWFDGKLEHRVSVPQLPDARLAGGRISNVSDRPAAYISYERSADTQGAPARRIGLFVFDDAKGEVEAPPLADVQVGSSLGYNVAVWREQEIVYELVSDLDESDIRRMLDQQMARKSKASRPMSPEVHAQPVSLQP